MKVGLSLKWNYNLEPKDVGFSKGRALETFRSWLIARDVCKDLDELSDEKFDSEFQKFLRAVRKEQDFITRSINTDNLPKFPRDLINKL